MTTNTNDATRLLAQDHREVEAMFEKFEGLGERAMVGKKNLAGEICQALTVHTQLEEELFYPAVRECGKEFEDLIDEAVVEHASAKELIAQIEDMDAEDDLFDAKVKVLSEQIQHHVQEEEKELFPKVRKADLDLEVLGEQLQERKEQLEAGASDELVAAARRGGAESNRASR